MMYSFFVWRDSRFRVVNKINVRSWSMSRDEQTDQFDLSSELRKAFGPAPLCRLAPPPAPVAAVRKRGWRQVAGRAGGTSRGSGRARRVTDGAIAAEDLVVVASREGFVPKKVDDAKLLQVAQAEGFVPAFGEHLCPPRPGFRALPQPPRTPTSIGHHSGRRTSKEIWPPME